MSENLRIKGGAVPNSFHRFYYYYYHYYYYYYYYY